MKKVAGVFIFAIALIVLCRIASAQVVSTNSTGSEKNTFYTNESVYFTTAQNVTNNMTNVRVYIVADSNAWSDGSNISTFILSNIFQTNSSGYINKTLLWQNPAVGKYDIVVDRDADGYYNSSYDFVDSLTATGFEVTVAPAATLAVSAGSNTSSDHAWDDTVNGSSDNVVLQFKLTAGSYEDVSLRSVALTASGSGDDKNDVTMIRITTDTNNDGKYSSEENLLAMEKFLKDDGISTLTVTNGYTILANTTSYFLVIYTMSSSIAPASTFGCSVASVSALGVSSNTAIGASGLPVSCSVTTIAGQATTSSTTTSSTSTTSSSTVSTTTIPPEKVIVDNIFVISAAVVTIVIPVVIFFLLERRGKVEETEYEKLREKWSQK